jgi:hypothetical protein
MATQKVIEIRLARYWKRNHTTRQRRAQPESFQRLLRDITVHVLLGAAPYLKPDFKQLLLNRLTSAQLRTLEQHGKPASQELDKYISNFRKEGWLVVS